MFIQTMDTNVATQTLIHAVKCAYERGAFTIGEVEVVSKSIRVLAEPQEKNDNATKLKEAARLAEEEKVKKIEGDFNISFK